MRHWLHNMDSFDNSISVLTMYNFNWIVSQFRFHTKLMNEKDFTVVFCIKEVNSSRMLLMIHCCYNLEVYLVVAVFFTVYCWLFVYFNLFFCVYFKLYCEYSIPKENHTLFGQNGLFVLMLTKNWPHKFSSTFSFSLHYDFVYVFIFLCLARDGCTSFNTPELRNNGAGSYSAINIETPSLLPIARTTFFFTTAHLSEPKRT